jgi:hypothetical protein
MLNEQFVSYSMAIISYIRWDNNDDVRFVLDQHDFLDFYSATSLKHQSLGRHVTPLGHISLISSQPLFAFTSWFCDYGEKQQILIL